MKTVGFIFARGGSKGLPGKNIKPLAGKPMLQYAIDVAREVTQIDGLFVSTDDEDIAKVAQDAGVEVIHRPAELASDTAPEWLAWQHAVDYVEQRHGKMTTFVSLPATSPLRAAEDVNNALEAFAAEQADVCIGITEANRSPFFNMVQCNEDGALSIVNAESGKFARRQDVPEVFDITTVVYVMKPEFIQSANNLFDGKVVGVHIPKERAVDIDDHIDFLLAEAILLQQQNEAN